MLPALTVPTPLPPPAEPPLCSCTLPSPCTWGRSRWWCAEEGEGGGCGFELKCAATARTPLCYCSLPASFRYNRWWCPREGDGCRFSRPLDAEPLPPERLSSRGVQLSHAKGVASMLTAVAYGPLNDFAFVVPSITSGATLALHARSRLLRGQAICAYTWTDLVVSDTATAGKAAASSTTAAAHNGAAAIPHPRSEEAGPAAFSAAPSAALSVARLGWFANHSSAHPNARLERWAPPGHLPAPLWDREMCVSLDGNGGGSVLMLVATETIEIGREIRHDHSIGRCGYSPPPPPDEDRWRGVRAKAPPACGSAGIFALTSSEDLEYLSIDLPGLLTPEDEAAGRAPKPSAAAAGASCLLEGGNGASAAELHADALVDGRLVAAPGGVGGSDAARGLSGTHKRRRAGKPQLDDGTAAVDKKRKKAAQQAAQPASASAHYGAAAAAAATAAAAVAAGSADTDSGSTMAAASADAAGAGACGGRASASTEEGGVEETEMVELTMDEAAESAEDDEEDGLLDADGAEDGASGARRIIAPPSESDDDDKEEQLYGWARPTANPGQACLNGLGLSGTNGETTHFAKGDLVEVHEAFKVSGHRNWYTGFVAYAWYDDSEPWTGYAIQFIHDETLEGSLEADFERRVPANRVRAPGGIPRAVDAHLANNPTLVAAARSLAVKATVGQPKSAVTNGRARRNSALVAQRRFEF